jgi:CRP-like cAMP-binding protein
LLGNRLLKDAARDTLESYGEEVVPVLAYLLEDTDEQPWVRRHIPATLARIPCQASMDALVRALPEQDGFLRFKVVDAIGALSRRHPELTFSTEAIERLIHGETARYYTYLTLRYNIVKRDPDGARALLVRALDDKLKRTLDRIYRELGLLYPWKQVAAARRTIETGDAHSRANAVEFLDTLMTGTVRKRVTPIIDEMPLADRVRHANSVLKTRERDLEDTLARLIHEEDSVLAASAIHMVVERGVQNLADDLDFVVSHATAEPLVVSAAAWAKAALAHDGAVGGAAEPGPLHVVGMADRLRAIRLFEFVSVDEMFRIAGRARQTRYEAGHVLAEAGHPPAEVFFLLEGTAQLSGGSQPEISVSAPAAPGFEDLLVDRPISQTLTATSPTMCVTFSASEFLTMMADNIAMAQGLFQMFLADRDASVMAPVGRVAGAPAGNGDQLLNPIDKALLLRQNPYFGTASVAQLIDLAAVARLVPIATGTELSSDGGGPAMFHVLHGDVRVQNGDGHSQVAGAGCTLFLIETLAGRAPKYRAVAGHDGHVLRLDHDDLFEVLSEHFDLLQGVFGGVLSTRR